MLEEMVEELMVSVELRNGKGSLTRDLSFVCKNASIIIYYTYYSSTGKCELGHRGSSFSGSMQGDSLNEMVPLEAEFQLSDSSIVKPACRKWPLALASLAPT